MNILLALSMALTWISSQPHTITQSETDLLFEPAGACMAADRQVSIGELIFISNEEISFVNRRGLVTWRIDGETVLANTGNDQSTLTLDVDSFLDLNTDLDIEIGFVYWREEFLLYWRETYLHRIYRYGLLRIYEDDLQLVCEGVGGITSMH